MQKKKMKTTTQIYSYHRTLTEIICDAALRRRIAGINNKPVKTYTIYFRRRAKETLLTDISTSLQQDYVSVRIGLSSLTTTFNTTVHSWMDSLNTFYYNMEHCLRKQCNDYWHTRRNLLHLFKIYNDISNLDTLHM